MPATLMHAAGDVRVENVPVIKHPTDALVQRRTGAELRLEVRHVPG